MSRNFKTASSRILVPVSCAFFIFVLSFHCAAQSKPLPRVGTIKDYPATGLMTGCGNLYFTPASQPAASDTAYIFLARGDGTNAWMNLNGRDIRLRQIKSSGRDKQNRHGYHYRWGTLRVSVVIEDFKPEGAPLAEDDAMYKMKITLRQGRAVRIVQAVGSSDC